MKKMSVFFIFGAVLTLTQISWANPLATPWRRHKASEYYDLINSKNEELARRIYEMETSKNPEYDQEKNVDLAYPRNKIIIAGDSWGVFPCAYRSMENALKTRQAQLSNDNRCLRTSKLGIEAREWIGSSQDQRLKKYISANKNIKYIYLSLGGNDLMAKWNKNFTEAQELQLFNETFEHIQKAINNYLELRPDIKIILSGYDFPHFKKNHLIPMYEKIYKNMGEPTDQRINEGLTYFSQHMTRIADYKNVYYIHHLGLSQYYDGVPEKLFPPWMTAPPDQISPFSNPSALGGNTLYPSSERSMTDWFWFIYDAFHLNEKNYDRLMLHTFDNVLVRIN